MLKRLFYAFLFSFSFQTLKGFENYDIQESGRSQYQLLQERGKLPQYGSCWKAGLEYLEKGCKYITEQIQSEIALHLANCFLAMSGHVTYNCHSDKKYNLRAICINNMNDRAFNVYTEFYTHTQNMCGFLQGHVWQEMIAENTMVVGKQLKETAQNQKGLLEAQRESLKLQEQMLQHGKVLEDVLENLFASFKEHQDILNILAQTVSDLQNWIIGEMSWFDSILFYAVSILMAFILTSSYRTSSARLVIFLMLFINYLLERFICFIYIFISDEDSSNMSSKIHNYIWSSRYCFILSSVLILLYFSVAYTDNSKKQLKILCLIKEQNKTILEILQNSPRATNLIDKLYLNGINENIKNSGSLKYAKDISNKLHKEYFNEVDTSSDSIKLVATRNTASRNEVKMKSHSTVDKDKYNLRSTRSESKVK